jgi:hypothetical protein
MRPLILHRRGYDFNWLVGRVAHLLAMEPDEVLKPGRYPRTVMARSILLYWAHRELGLSTVGLAKRLKLAPASVSQSIKRGEGLILDRAYTLF